jgi:hypothetical protein
MKKVKILLLAFAIVGLLVSVSIKEVQAGCPPGPSPECNNCCKLGCSAAQYKSRCIGATGEDKKDCVTLANIEAECCYFDCLESHCDQDIGESLTCEALEAACPN